MLISDLADDLTLAQHAGVHLQDSHNKKICFVTAGLSQHLQLAVYLQLHLHGCWHTGHVAFCFSHVSMQAWWKLCVHGRMRSTCPSPDASSKQMQQVCWPDPRGGAGPCPTTWNMHEDKGMASVGRAVVVQTVPYLTSMQHVPQQQGRRQQPAGAIHRVTEAPGRRS